MQSNEAGVRQRAIQQFRDLSYQIIDGTREEQGECVVTGRQRLSEVVLRSRLRAAMQEINPDCTGEEIELAIADLLSDQSLSGLVQSNEQVYKKMKDGIGVTLAGTSEQAGERHGNGKKIVQVIDWREVTKNDFTLVSHFWVEGKLGKRCLDLVAFVNGLPFVLLEIAESELPNIFNRIDQDSKATLPALFWYNAFIVVANAFSCKMGSLSAPWEHFFQWKRIRDERENESDRLETLIEGTCEKTRLLDIVENFTLFDKHKGLSKLVSRNHQYLGVNNAIASLLAWRKECEERGEAARHGKLGVFWHTQGSGKSYSMVFFVRKVQRTIDNSYTFVVVTDREDLNKQIYENFRYTDTITELAESVQARDAKHLKQRLREHPLLIFTLIQKFRSEKPGQDYPKVSESEKIIVLADEAHRTQYDTLAKNMRTALPRAAFLGFTGTPLMDGEEQTRATFGNYVSIYNFRRAINDGVTVRLYYENHTPEISQVNEQFDEEMAELLEEAGLRETEEQKVIEQYARAESIFVKGERLDVIAADIVKHFMNRGYMGKAMVVSINKITAVRTYNRVKEQWERYKEELQRQLEQESDLNRKVELVNQIRYMEQTKMAVVVSASQDDTERFATFSRETGEQVEIAEHHQRFNREKLDEAFKDASNPLRIAFVCGMWMTGFDAQCLSTLYLDRPMKGHTLMQTIARVNRVYYDKNNGLIVDYASNERARDAALAKYASEDSSALEGERPIGEKSELVEDLRKALSRVKQFSGEQGIAWQELLVRVGRARDKEGQQVLVEGAVNRLVAYDEIKLNAQLLTGEVDKLYKAILPDPVEPEFTLPVHVCRLIKEGIYSTTRISISSIRPILSQATNLVQSSLEVREREERISADTIRPRGSFDLCDIDLKALEGYMRNGTRNINLERWRNLLAERLRRMAEVNPGEVKHLERLERIVRRYNEGCANWASDPPLHDEQEKIRSLAGIEEERERLQEEYMEALLELTEEVGQEEQRPTREGLEERELAVFDLLTEGVELSEEERGQVKEVVRRLFAALEPTFGVLDWQKKPQMRGRVEARIEDELCGLPEAKYDDAERRQKGKAVWDYVRMHYRNDGTSSVA